MVTQPIVGGGKWIRLYNFTVVDSDGGFNSDSTTFGKFQKVTGSSAPTFTTNKYFKKESGSYSLLSSEPADWSTNYSDYYSSALSIMCNFRNIISSNTYLSRIRVKLFVPVDSYLDSELKGYIGFDTDVSGSQLNNYGLVNYRLLKGNTSVNTYTVFEGFADPDFISYAKIDTLYPEVAKSANSQISYGRDPIVNDCIRRVQLSVNTLIGFPVGMKVIIEGIDK